MSETTNQENKSVELLSIKDLLKYNFVIPSYQRGYRWEKREVEDLLNDIYDFSQNNDEGFYCLQPLVLKEISDEKTLNELEIKDRDNVYEVIDGQQRLTTIYLILKYLKSKKIIEENIYTITYSTRTNSKRFLEETLTDKELSKEEKQQCITHIDFEYIYNAYHTIKDWFNENKKTIKNILLSDKTDKKSVQFIWYEPSDNANAIEIFTRINIGKIPLTNSELIKALFLQKANFKYDKNFDEALYEHTQIEIASEWDYIENTLQDDRFWGFINNDMDKKYNRIDYIFEIIANIELNELKEEEKNKILILIGNDSHSTFRYFYKKWKDNEKKISFMQNIWEKIRYCFYAMNKWYNDLTFYHYIGFLIHCDNKENNILNLYNLYIKCSTKKNFKKELKERIKKLIIETYKINYKENEGFNIDYYSTKKDIIRNFLLLYNIEYMLKNQSSNAKFPFDLFKGKTWDIEHIESQTPQSPEEVEKYIEDILNIKNIDTYYNLSNFKKEFENYKNNNEKNIDIWNEFIEIFYKDNKENHDEEFKNSLGNLTLLDSSTNRGYGNAFFVIKRKIILEKDKNSYFIPICTKYVFLKYFDENIETSNVHQWTKTDASKYEKDISKTLNEFLPKKEDEQ